MSSVDVRPTVPLGAYAERATPRAGWLDRAYAAASGPVVRRLPRRHRLARFVTTVAELGRPVTDLSDAGLREAAGELRGLLRREGFTDPLTARAFALVREVASRTLGLRHYDVQLMGGWVLLHGMVAEMDTGEGKTLTATLAAGAAALAGLPVHVITVNDYLAARDAGEMGPVYRALGLTVGLITHELDRPARRAAYGADVTYCTNKELTFDYLRDRLVLGGRPARVQLQLERLGGRDARLRQLVLRGLHYAIVDEADSVLVDEARTPLVISGAVGAAHEHQLCQEALGVARALEPERDFAVEGPERVVHLTTDGRERVAELARPLGGLWTGRQRREELVRQALVAERLMLRDQHYLVRDGKVQIVDEFTGRLSPDRSWERGLHQLIETKEGCALTSRNEPLARISYQRFFRRYLRLAGMTGTAAEVAGELWSVYRLAVVRVPTNRPIVRRAFPDRVFATEGEKWVAVVARIAEVRATGRPILVGTRSVAASEELARRLVEAGLPHVVLNARQDRGEADIVARAGGPGRITVATNMAGRGTDIRLAPGVVELGGLHVIATERHEARRIDRQLFGRCGRQGDPGSHEAIVALEDEIVAVHGRPAWRGLAPAARIRLAQRAAERLHSQARRQLLKQDEQLDTTLAFSGQTE